MFSRALFSFYIKIKTLHKAEKSKAFMSWRSWRLLLRFFCSAEEWKAKKKNSNINHSYTLGAQRKLCHSTFFWAYNVAVVDFNLRQCLVDKVKNKNCPVTFFTSFKHKTPIHSHFEIMNLLTSFHFSTFLQHAYLEMIQTTMMKTLFMCLSLEKLSPQRGSFIFKMIITILNLMLGLNF